MEDFGDGNVREYRGGEGRKGVRFVWEGKGEIGSDLEIFLRRNLIGIKNNGWIFFNRK